MSQSKFKGGPPACMNSHLCQSRKRVFKVVSRGTSKMPFSLTRGTMMLLVFDSVRLQKRGQDEAIAFRNASHPDCNSSTVCRKPCACFFARGTAVGTGTADNISRIPRKAF